MPIPSVKSKRTRVQVAMSVYQILTWERILLYLNVLDFVNLP